MPKILGISSFYHDAAAAITIDGVIIAAVQEERFNRIKHTSDFPVQSIVYCLEEAGLTIDQLDAIVFYDKPLLTFERLLQTYYAFAPKGIVSFLKSIPIWLEQKLFLKKQIRDGLAEVMSYDKKKLKLLFTEHHLSHAASTFFTSPFEHAAILTIDGVGEWATATISEGKGNTIITKKELKFPHSIGLLYSAFTYYLGFTVNSGEYKLMGLAPYGNPNSDQTKRYIHQIKEQLISIKEDGSIWLDQSYFNYSTGLTMTKDSKWESLFGLKRRQPESELLQAHCNLGYAIQYITEEVVLKMSVFAKAETAAPNLCLAGGVALNCVANGKLLKKQLFKDIYVQPASGDAGGALGAALAVHYMYFDNTRDVDPKKDSMQGSYLGPYYSDKEITILNKRQKAVATKVSSFDILSKQVALEISEGAIIGWFQGRMEFGPRALGNRSIIGDPSNTEMQKKLNLKIKKRESFRPFAPSVLDTDASDFFDLETASPYMTLVSNVKKSIQKEIPSNYHELPLLEKLYCERSNLQAITHLDFSARIQTVHKETNPKYWQLLQNVKQETGKGILINTSFNVRGEPIVCTPEDAYNCFMNTEMDILVIENYIYYKKQQPNWDTKERWLKTFKED
ncbi:carbamoyltransferase [uncultured Aquimarina sp.]|uniref:carbamoyltransferase family protein n=1 Tax=uncultured Aquimarina sp. TaxID=575652 RepID=UPI002622CEFC|nr:carbamoyltransferase [uncultured Aquimarina sp.]